MTLARPCAPEIAGTAPGRSYRLYSFFMAAFTTVLLCSNLIGPAKVCRLEFPWIGPLVFGAGNIFFPLSYIFGDVLTEVYGYARARRVIWAGFGAMVFATVMSWAIIHLPADSSEYNARLQPAIELIFGPTWRIVGGSILAFWAGDFANSYVLARLKLLTKGRFLWTRTIGSTLVGQGVDSLIFYPLAFAGIWTGETLARVVLFNWLFKVSVEVLFTPITYWIVGTVKRIEGEDYYDRDTDFTPFSLRD